MNTPNTIYLQFYGDSDPCDDTPIDAGDVTWCKDKIFGSDELYVSAKFLSEKAAAYRNQAKSLTGDLKDPYQQMAWAFELVLELAKEATK